MITSASKQVILFFISAAEPELCDTNSDGATAGIFQASILKSSWITISFTASAGRNWDGHLDILSHNVSYGFDFIPVSQAGQKKHSQRYLFVEASCSIVSV